MQPEGLRGCEGKGEQRLRNVRLMHRRDDRKANVKPWKFRVNRYRGRKGTYMGRGRWRRRWLGGDGLETLVLPGVWRPDSSGTPLSSLGRRLDHRTRSLPSRGGFRVKEGCSRAREWSFEGR